MTSFFHTITFHKHYPFLLLPSTSLYFCCQFFFQNIQITIVFFLLPPLSLSPPLLSLIPWLAPATPAPPPHSPAAPLPWPPPPSLTPPPRPPPHLPCCHQATMDCVGDPRSSSLFTHRAPPRPSPHLPHPAASPPPSPPPDYHGMRRRAPATPPRLPTAPLP